MKVITTMVLVSLLLILTFGCTRAPNAMYEDTNLAYVPRLTGTTGMGDVAIELRPKFVDGVMVVDLSANTHSVNLDQYDLTNLVMLDADGSWVKPSLVPGLSGHHSSGELLFPLSRRPESFRIVIRGIPKEEERIFSWNGS